MYFYGKADFENFDEGNKVEWYLPNGLGGYSSSTIINSTYRKQNGYFIASLKSPVNRMLLLAKTVETVLVGNKCYELEAERISSSSNQTKILSGYQYLETFQYNYIPAYTYQVNGVQIIKRISPHYGHNTIAITYEISSLDDAKVLITPRFNLRDHCDVSSKSNLNFKVKNDDGVLKLKSIGNIIPNLFFYYSVGKMEERNKKITDEIHMDFDENTGDFRVDHHFTPVDLVVECPKGEKILVEIICTIEKKPKLTATKIIENMERHHQKLIKKAGLKDQLAKDLVIAADTFICKRSSTNLKTILAGLPWFTDWGRDTMIAFTGCTLVSKRFDEAKEILTSFAKYEKNGLIPNMFPDDGTSPLYNTVDASLWYFYAVKKYFDYLTKNNQEDDEFIKTTCLPVLEKIIRAYTIGTDFSIRMEEDGLISAGSDLDQITWMDVRVNGIVVTPRHGKPVEINALWYNALMIMDEFARRYHLPHQDYVELAGLVKKSFNEKFFSKETKCLYDVIDPVDNSIRPNQIWVLSLPYKVLDDDTSKIVFETVTKELYNTYGLRSLASSDDRFEPLYEGELVKRDFCYHMGTTWGFLIGGYLDAFAYLYRNEKDTLEKVLQMVNKFIPHLKNGCINGIAEIFDGEYASRTRGCATQAWSVGELLRTYYENYLDKRKENE